MLEVVVISEGQRREILLLVFGFGAYLQSNETRGILLMNLIK